MFQFAVVATVTYTQLVSAGFYSFLNSWIRTPPVENPTQNTELLFAFLVFRHGDRTIPIEADVFYTDKSKELLAATREYGFGQLTLRGKQRAYKLGQFIRERYNELLSPKYNSSEVFIGSTEFTRTRMSVLAALAAIYPPVEPRWSETINWEPVPYTYVKILYDYNAAMLNCPKYTDNMFKLYYDCPTEMKKFSSVLKRLSQLIETDVSNYPVKVALLASVLECQQSLGIPLSHEMEELYDETKEAAAVALKYLYAQKDYLELQAGPLLKEFIDNANLVIQGKRTQRVRIHSAHDFNVYVLQVIIQATPIQGPPPFSALISLELRRDIKTGKHMILPVYVPRPGEKPVYLHIKGCDSLPCNYDQFLQITAPYVLDEDSWRKKCEWTPDLVLDKTVFQ